MFDAEKFIFAIEPRKAIWDKNSPDYVNKELKVKAWDEVGEEMFSDWSQLSLEDRYDREKDLHKKWKNITDCFRKELRIIKRQAQGEPAAKKKKRYMFFDILQFLVPALKPCKRCYNLTPEADTSDFSSLDIDSKDPLENMPEALETKHVKSKSTKCIDKKKNSEINSYEQELIDVFREDSNDSVSKYDSDKLFLLSLVPMFNKLTEDQNITARIEIMQLLQGILYSQRL